MFLEGSTRWVSPGDAVINELARFLLDSRDALLRVEGYLDAVEPAGLDERRALAVANAIVVRDATLSPRVTHKGKGRAAEGHVEFVLIAESWSGIDFHSGSSQLDADSIIDAVAKYLEEHPADTLQIAGYSDEEEPPPLATQRALAVERAVVSRNVDLAVRITHRAKSGWTKRGVAFVFTPP